MRTESRVVVGLLLLITGVLLLMQNLGLLGAAWNTLWALLFGLGGLAFLALFLTGRQNWWASIPGLTLLSLGLLVALEQIAPRSAASWGGPLFLGGIGLGFALVYVARRDHWWAVVPAGVLLTLAATAWLGQAGRGQESGSVFLLGLAFTFLLVYLLPSVDHPRGWALIPAGVLFVLGIAAGVANSTFAAYIWPLALILIGVYLLYRSRVARRA